MLSLTNEPLFVRPTPYISAEKTAAVTLDRDGDAWEEQIIKALHQEHPYIASRDVQIFITRDDPENGVGVGSIHVDGKLVIPLIIDKFKLAPLDIIWEGGKLNPLTRTTFERRLVSSSIGKPVVPGQGEVTDTSLYSTVQPPFDGKYTYAEFAAAGEAACLDGALSSLADADQQLLQRNKVVLPVLQKYAQVVAAPAPVPAPSVQIEEVAQAFSASKIASAGAYTVLTGSGPVPAIIFDRVFDANAAMLPKLGFLAALDGSGRCAVLSPEADIYGTPLPADAHGVIAEPRAGDTGIFFKVAAAGTFCSRPIKLAFRLGDGTFSGTSDGKVIRLKKTADLKVPFFADGCLAIPQDWFWIKTGAAVKPTQKPVATDRLLKLARNGVHHRAWIGDESFSGDAEQVGDFVRSRLGESAAKTALAGLEKKASVEFKIVEKTTETRPSYRPIPGLNLLKEATYIRPADAFTFPGGDLGDLKFAAVTDDTAKRTVDALLGLNFLSAETVHRFIDKIEPLEESLDTVAKLLLASRLGLDVDSRPLRTAMFALDSVVRDLKELRNGAEVEEQEN